MPNSASFMFYCTGADNLSAHVKHLLTREGVQYNGTLSVIMFHHHWRGRGGGGANS